MPEQPRSTWEDVPDVPTDTADEELVEESVEHGMAASGGVIQIGAVTAGPESRRKRRHLGIGAWLALAWMVLVLVVAVGSELGVLPLDNPNVSDAQCARRGPLADEGSASGHLLGCDSNGRDMLSRLAHGAWTSMLVATGAIVFGFVVGGFLGMIAGYFSGKTDTVLTGIFNIFLSIPAIILALALVAFLQDPASAGGGSTALPAELILIIAIGVVSIPLLGRITRASALSWSQREFVLAARAQGAKNMRIMVREVLPNVLPAMFSIALLGVAVAIVAEGTLSILGVGVKAPTPSWGNIIGIDRGLLLSGSPHIVLEPALLIFFTVLALNFLGDVVRARFDVREGAI